MTFQVPQIPNTAAWLLLFNTVNLLANIVSNTALTIGSNSSGDSGVTGNFWTANTWANNVSSNNAFFVNTTSNNLQISTSFVLGNSSSNISINSTSLSIFSNSTSNLIINTPNTAQVANGQFFLNANGNFTTVPSVSYPISNSVVITNSQFTQVIDYWPLSSYNLANYNICVIDNVSNNFYSSRISMMCGGNNSILTEYAQITTNTSLGIFSSSSNSSFCILNFAPTSNSTTVKFFRELI